MVEKQTELTDLFKMLMQEKNPEYESKFFKKLNETVFWIPMIPEQEGMERKTFQLLMTGDERKFVPVFLHKKSKLGRFLEEQLIKMPYDKLKYLIIDSGVEINGIVINPFEENIVLDRKIMEVVDAQTMGMTLKRKAHQTKVNFRRPEYVPKGLIEALRLFFKKEIHVDFAWLLLSRDEEQEREHWMLLMDFQGQKIELFPKIADLMKRYMKPGDIFELIERNPSFNVNDLEGALIYSRTAGKIFS